MPTSNITKYCCQYVDYAFTFAYPSTDCGNSYTINITSVSTGGVLFSPWDQNRAISRSCFSVDSCINGDGVYVSYSVGCLPKVNYPLTFDYEIRENGVVIGTGSEETTSGFNDCPDGECPEVCGPLP